ncbi:protein-tyrosine phosphatase family protein [Sulfitobacter sp. SH24]|uniref:protein-tyrosine phosphatase family protein n=1 Tax=Sulfitobacter sp. SH24 TaxID=3421173 RepID=UPI003F4F5E41
MPIDTPRFDAEGTSIRAVIPTPRGGYLAMTGFPGLLTEVDGTPYLDPLQMTETLEGLRNMGARQLLVLTEEAELPEGAFPSIKVISQRVGLGVYFSEIIDFHVPGDAFLSEWPAYRTRFERALDAGETVALSCQYGAGRSGLVAAWLLMGAGLPAAKAIALVRNHFSEAIENQLQEDWLLEQEKG